MRHARPIPARLRAPASGRLVLIRHLKMIAGESAVKIFFKFFDRSMGRMHPFLRVRCTGSAGEAVRRGS